MDILNHFTLLYITLHKMSSMIKMLPFYTVKYRKALQNL